MKTPTVTFENCQRSQFIYCSS